MTWGVYILQRETGELSSVLSALHMLTRLVFIAILEGRVVPQDSLEDGPSTPTHRCGLHPVIGFWQTEYSASSGVSHPKKGNKKTDLWFSFSTTTPFSLPHPGRSKAAFVRSLVWQRPDVSCQQPRRAWSHCQWIWKQIFPCGALRRLQPQPIPWWLSCQRLIEAPMRNAHTPAPQKLWH